MKILFVKVFFTKILESSDPSYCEQSKFKGKLLTVTFNLYCIFLVLRIFKFFGLAYVSAVRTNVKVKKKLNFI